MIDLNNVSIIGRLTRDAELKAVSSGVMVSKFSIAVNSRKKSGDEWINEANFFDVTVWGKTAEFLHQYLVKGKQVGVKGELCQERWQQDGMNRSRVYINADLVQLLSSGNNQNGNSRNDSQENSYSPVNIDDL